MAPTKKSKPTVEEPPGPGASLGSTDTRNASLPEPNNSEPPTVGETTISQASSSAVTLPAPSSSTVDNTSTISLPSHTTPNKKGWLSGTGSWRSKAPAVVTTAKESIGVSGGATAELPGEDANKKSRDDSPKKFLTKRKSSKGDAIPASMTKVNVSSDGLVDDTEKSQVDTASTKDSDSTKSTINEPPLPPEPTVVRSDTSANWGWRAWWSRPDGYAEADKAKSEAQGTMKDAQSTPLPGATPSEESPATAKGLDAPPPSNEPEAEGSSLDGTIEQGTKAQEATSDNSSAAAKGPNGSWFWRWSNAQNAKAAAVDQAPNKPSEPVKADSAPAASEPDTTPSINVQAPPEVVNQDAEATTTSTSSTSPAKPSAWAFWFPGKVRDDQASNETGAQKHVGEVAVIGTPSQSHPEAAQFNEQAEPTSKPAEEQQLPKSQPAPKKSFMSLRGRSKAKNTSKPETRESTPKANPDVKSTEEASAVDVVRTQPQTATTAQPATKQAPKQPAPKPKQEPPNLLFPSFNSTYSLVQQPSFWQQLRQYFLGGEMAAPHLHINPSPPRIKKAVAIGVHGFFPAPIIQKVLGQPTGTSIRFANAAAAAIKDWTAARGYEPEIEQIALEGEGFISERVNSLWKLLLNWIDHLKAADFVLVACHSQGVPVAMMLVAKLIQFGCVNATRIGVCAMAGVNMGPFIEYKTKYFGPTAAELFEFSNPKSLVSQMYLAALDEVLRAGVRITYVGSIDDQLVSMESSTFSVLSHPYIYRAVFVDGRIHVPDFLTHLVGFTLKLRNLGLPDHGLIRELSPALAGSLYAGEGHSRVYEDPAVYNLAVRHALETTSLPISTSQQRPSTSGSFHGISIPVIGEKADTKDLYKLRVKEYESTASSTNPNPFFLPWAMRGLLEEEFVKKELGKEVEELLGMFEAWKPTAKQLKDVKFRLEGVRSKL